MNAQDIIDLEHDNVLGVYGRPPFVLEKGEGCTLYDTEGNAYLDCVAGIAVNALGYDDAGVNQAMQEAGATGMLHVSNLYHTAPNAQLAALLCETSFADKVHFCLTGADANEGAFKFARRYAYEKGNTEKYHILAFSNAFHGRLFGSLAATPRPQYQDPFKPLMPGVRFGEFNDLESAREQMDENVCAIIVEPVQGEGGIYAASQEFLQGLRDLADEYDAILMRQKVEDAMQPGDHASTFAGNPFTTHVAHHVVDRISDPEFLASVKEKGDLFVELLEELNSPHILEVRGERLMIGVQMDIEAVQIMTKAYDRGLMVLVAGTNVLRFVPPLVISEDEIKQAVITVGEILQEL